MLIIPDLVYTHHLFHVLNMTILKKKNVGNLCKIMERFLIYWKIFTQKQKRVYEMYNSECMCKIFFFYHASLSSFYSTL